MRSYRIVCVGSACGKTSFLSSLSNSSSFSTHSLPTIGADFIGITPSGEAISLGFFDCSSLELFADLRLDLYKDADALVLFFSDKSSFLALEAKWLIETREISGKPGYPVFVAQLSGAGVAERQAASWAEAKKFKYIKCDSGRFVQAVLDAFKKKSQN
jgi:GTPase SAR1 family protein